MPQFVFSELAAYYVNLDHRADRRRHMEKELARLGIQATRRRGMLPHEYTGDPTQVEVMRKRTPGAIGCAASQRAIIEYGAKSGRNVLVCEDDLVFSSDLAVRMARMEVFLKDRPWDIVWLGGTIHVNPAVWHKDDLGRDAECTSDLNIVRTYGAFSTHCYAVNGDSAGKIVQLLDDWLSRSMGIDWTMIQIQPQLQTFMFLPGCCKQLDNKSDIGNGMTIFSNFKKLGVHWFADKLADVDMTTFDWAEAKVTT